MQASVRSLATTFDGAAQFSLFSGDWLHRVYSVLHISDRASFFVLKRCILVVTLTWIPVALLAVKNGLIGGGMVPTNFFADFAAYAQFLIGMPLFMIAEPIINSATRAVATQLVSCDIIRPNDRQRLIGVHRLITRLRKSYWPDLVCIVIAYALSLTILIPEFRPNPSPTWHVRDYTLWRTFTGAGAWEFLVSLPLLNYTWLRYIWKILLWIFYLRCVSRMRLDLYPTHPDLTGGIGFVSDAQGRFAVLILAYGISNIAATVGYEIVILHYDMGTLPVWGPVLGFAIGAPVLFTLPLFMFTNQLYRRKSKALAICLERVSKISRRVETYWLNNVHGGHAVAEEARELSELTTMSAVFDRIKKMRVVPFDLRSFGQLAASSFGSIATLLPLLHFDEHTASIFEAIGKLLGHLGGKG